jgi:hypothetical protein
VLDIGADVGAAVVYAPAALDGVEIEIKRQASDWDGTHTAIRRRPGPRPAAAPVFAALFDHLPVGLYDFRLRSSGHASSDHASSGHASSGHGDRTCPVRVCGGQVIEVTLPESWAR